MSEKEGRSDVIPEPNNLGEEARQLDAEPSEMVEKVARAMWQGEWDRAKTNERAANEAAGREVYVSYVPRWEDCNLIFLGYARAAIEAMKVPTEKMLRASPVVGTGLNEQGVWAVNTKPAQDVWAAMVDAALSDPQTAKNPASS